ncbi:HEAT repeat domain-containing protein [Spirosoma sp. KNUC1025]|uniref:HEAT repeat domain-containing protein n=1 Tax=Spirosoma sp. KNUC1025 TaxID=2894082 RepID=UPI001E3B3D14|nr:HEAT repeat domain-containing protein [Spirosoma sp. KNUC1025]UFH57643.1 HEAT repeat domain-containing protein [Spirosoma sp. KNUC1025]
MAIPKAELIKMINLDEPDYQSIVKKLSTDDIPTLVELSNDPDPAIATKAISCLGLMQSEKALAGLVEIVKHPDAVRRVAVANSLKNMTSEEGVVPLLNKLLDDHDIGVKKFALKTVESGNLSPLKEKVRQMQQEANTTLKALAQQVLQKL